MDFEQQRIESLKRDMELFKQSMNDWILFLNNHQRETRTQVREMERRVRFLEAEKDIKF